MSDPKVPRSRRLLCNRELVSSFAVLDEEEPGQIVGENVYFCTPNMAGAVRMIRSLGESPQDLILMRNVLGNWKKAWR